MEEKNAFVAGLFCSAIFAILIALIVTYERKDECRKKHDVYKCERTRNPFTPVATE